MSTCGFCGFRINSKDKTTYNHNDSYPGGLGVAMIHIILSNTTKIMIATAKKIKLVNKNEKPTPNQIERYYEFLNLSVSTRNADDWYCLLHGTQGRLDLYIKGYVEHMLYDNGQYREWGYIINLDSKELDVYAKEKLVCTIKFSTIRKMKVDNIIPKLLEIHENGNKFLGLQIWEKKKKVVKKYSIKDRLDAI